MEDTEASAPAQSTAVATAPQPAEPISFGLSDSIVVQSDPRNAAAESIRALRVHLTARHVQEGRRGLVICETGQAGGVFVAVNLAMSFAEAGIRTLLIDADLRQPKLHEYVTPSRHVDGLGDIIDRPELSIASAIHQVTPNLSVIYAGETGDRAQELLASNRFAYICDLCLREFEVTIAITPPANYYSDARRTASLLRDVLIVARRDVSFVSDVKTLLSELSSDGARVVGTIYNDF